MPRSLLLAALPVLTGCRGLPEAPTELSELSAWLFQNFETEDPELLAAGLGNLQAFFEQAGIASDFDDQAWELARLQERDVADAEHPDRDPSDALPVGLVMASAFTPTEHAQVFLLADQTPVEPSSPEIYERSFIEPDDPSCFLGQSCDLIRSDNEIRKENLVFSIDYSKRKDYRWGEVAGQPAALGRSWMLESAWAEEEQNAIYQSYSIDVFLPHEQGAIRYLALWSEASMLGAGDEVILALMRSGMEDILLATDAWLEDEG